MESWGFKKRMTGLKHPWQRRYFRIDTNSTELSYLKTPSDTKTRGTIDVLTLLRLAPTDEGLKNSRDPAVKTFGSFALDLHTSEPRVYHIIFESQKILEGWVLALWKVCDQSVCKLHPTFSAIKGIRAATVQPSKQPQQQRTLEGGGGASSGPSSGGFDPTPMPLPPALAARVAAAAASRGGEGSIGGGGSGGNGNGNGGGGGGGSNSSSASGPGTTSSPLPSASSSTFFSSSRNIASSPANPFKLVDLDRDDPEADRMLMGGGGAVEMQSLRQLESSGSGNSSRGLPPSRGGGSFRGRGRGGGRGRGRGGGGMPRPTFGAASKSELSKRLLEDEEDEEDEDDEEDDSDSDSDDDSDDDEDEEDEEGGKKGGCCTIA